MKMFWDLSKFKYFRKYIWNMHHVLEILAGPNAEVCQNVLYERRVYEGKEKLFQIYYSSKLVAQLYCYTYSSVYKFHFWRHIRFHAFARKFKTLSHVNVHMRIRKIL